MKEASLLRTVLKRLTRILLIPLLIIVVIIISVGAFVEIRLDLAHLGIFGHSFGGAAAAQVCHMDARCKAGIDIDGDLFGDVVQTGLDKPFMVLQLGTDPCSDLHLDSGGLKAG